MELEAPGIILTRNCGAEEAQGTEIILLVQYPPRITSLIQTQGVMQMSCTAPCTYVNPKLEDMLTLCSTNVLGMTVSTRPLQDEYTSVDNF